MAEIKAKTKVFVDLDDTLLNTSKLKEDLFSKIALMGVPRAEIEANYREARTQYGAAYLKPFAESFQEFGIDGQILYPGLRQFVMQNGENYIIEDRLLWLDRYQTNDYELYLVTHGNEDIQETKVQSVHLENLFEGRVIYVKGGKAEEIRKHLAPGEKFIFVDDKQEEINEIISEFPEQAEVWQAAKSVNENGETEYNDPEGYYSPIEIGREGKNY